MKRDTLTIKIKPLKIDTKPANNPSYKGGDLFTIDYDKVKAILRSIVDRNGNR